MAKMTYPLSIHEENPGHYGGRKMYERARNVGASLWIEIIPDRGITVALQASGRLAYKDSSVGRAFRK